MAQNEARPPYVRFHQFTVEDRVASKEAGHMVTRDIIHVKVTQIGSGDTYENVAEDWLNLMEQEARAEPPRLPIQWVEAWRGQYERYKKSFANEINGTPLRGWQLIMPSQVDACIQIGCFTVEDLAELNEEGLSALGLGARELKRKAAAWLEASSTSGKTVQTIVDLEAQNKSLTERNRSLEEQIQALSAELESLKGPKAVVKPK